jgi:hypothetical protein
MNYLIMRVVDKGTCVSVNAKSHEMNTYMAFALIAQILMIMRHYAIPEKEISKMLREANKYAKEHKIGESEVKT